MGVGGKVIQTYLENKERLWLNTLDQGGEPTSVLVHPDGHENDIALGDKVWWQGGKVYWTSAKTMETVSLAKIGGSGVNHPLGKEYQITYDMSRVLEQKKARIRELERQLADQKERVSDLVAPPQM